MLITATPFDTVFIITPQVHSDSRGYFYETYQAQRYKENNLPHFVQDNYSHSKYGVVRGLHYQQPNAQGKLVGVTRGKVWDVVVDIRASSATFGQSFSIILDDEKHQQLYVPPGFAHGFCVLSEQADFYYKCSEYYSPKSERGIIWNDSELNIPWPITDPIVSAKDAELPKLCDIPHELLFA